jgi:uncharacterized 2Fe-2S/4Fe-4S cluster protein (DUF4445 family)
LAAVYLPPIISGFVGADITAGILATQLDAYPGTALFIDIGTNGEIVLAQNGQLVATSTAAGPAFEGMNIECGMRAAIGAIELFKINDDTSLQIDLIGNKNPKNAIGICGSGLLDVVGELVRVGAIDKTGRFVKPEKGDYPQTIKDRFKPHGDRLAFFLTDKVFLTQKDVRQVQLAKGAIRSGIDALLANLNISQQDVDVVKIAGSFGYHLRAQSLLNLGLLPAAFADKIEFVGNTSQSGATSLLLNTQLRATLEQLATKIQNIELANTPDFQTLFINSLGF